MSTESTKRFLLDYIIRAYIENLEPIGSSSLKNMYKLRYSPASIRCYFRELDNDGYLQQEHISGGRKPTALALKQYWQKTLSFSDDYAIDYDKLEGVSKELDCAIFLKQQIDYVLTRVLNVSNMYIVLDFDQFAITIKYNKALFRFLEDSIGMDMNYILNISKQINATALTAELNKYIENSIFEIKNIKSFLRLCSKTDIDENKINMFIKGDIVNELEDGVYFEELLPEGYMAVSTSCASEYCDLKMVAVGNMMTDYKYLYKEIAL